jgi:SAM-dependent methyltransferase
MVEPQTTATRPMLLFGVTIFLSAALLFEVQPLIAKAILPWFGGSAAVWTTCMLFFQVTLLAGYAYAHALTRLAPSRQAAVHLVLLGLSLLSLPIVPATWWKPTGAEDPLLRILGLLAMTIGLPYLVLSASSPLLQAWYSRLSGGAVPYRFFALSNAGSLIALLSYPVLVEPALTGHVQAWSWSAGYAVFAVLCATIAWRARRAPPLSAEPLDCGALRPSPGSYAIWIGLPACASALLLAVTSHLSQNVAAIPLLWILPLSIYLLSFILCFESDRWYRRPVFLPLFAVALCAMAYAQTEGTAIVEIRVLIPLFLAGLFVCCMVCHGEVARRKPAPRYATSFYLAIATGGALGGIFVGVIAPRVFNALYDLQIALAACALGAVAVFAPDLPRQNPRARVTWGLAALLSLVMIGYLAWDTSDTLSDTVLLARNFYGALRVTDFEAAPPVPEYRELDHGTIDHGEQFLEPKLRRLPTTYYAPSTGLGLALRTLQPTTAHMRVGVIGLGAGTTAAWGRKGDDYRIYEINPIVETIARDQFTYLADSRAQIDVVTGDARLSLEREPAQRFDLIAVDAFSGDSIPVHLLTREAMGLYWRHLKPDGVLAVHVSNQYLDLAPVVELEADAFDKTARQVENDEDDATQAFSADWVLVTSRPDFFNRPLLRNAAALIAVPHGLRIWTDDYSNLWQILR